VITAALGGNGTCHLHMQVNSRFFPTPVDFVEFLPKDWTFLYVKRLGQQEDCQELHAFDPRRPLFRDPHRVVD